MTRAVLRHEIFSGVTRAVLRREIFSGCICVARAVLRRELSSLDVWLFPRGCDIVTKVKNLEGASIGPVCSGPIYGTLGVNGALRN